MNICKYYTPAFLLNRPGREFKEFYCNFNPESGEEHQIEGEDALDWTLKLGGLEKKGAPCNEGDITTCPYKEHSTIRKEAIDIATKFQEEERRESLKFDRAFPGILE